jgi:DNA polymerase-3 subunit delta'
MPFVDVEGQDRVRELLKTARRNARLAHGLLFVGADGSGRERMAIALAQALMCQSPVADDACGTCGPCTRVASSSHPDVLVVMSGQESARRGLPTDDPGKPSADIKLDAVRELSRRLRMHAYEGAARVGIVVNANTLRVEAANALLKTLEEPAPGTFLVLIAPGPRSVLDTLRSRCQILRFAPLEEEHVCRNLVQQHGIDHETAKLAARRADGSITRALTYADRDYLTRLDTCAAFFLAARQQSGADIVDLAANIGRGREHALEHLDEMSWTLHDRLCQAGRNGCDRVAQSLTLAVDDVGDAVRAIRGNAMPQLVLEALAVKMGRHLHNHVDGDD